MHPKMSPFHLGRIRVVLVVLWVLLVVFTSMESITIGQLPESGLLLVRCRLLPSQFQSKGHSGS